MLNIIIAGVGGQGVLTLARLIGEAAVERGLNALVAETHGLSQRGGSVVVHVRIGYEAPLVPVGGGDLLIGLELIESLRYAPYMKEGGEAVVDDVLIPPPAVRSPPKEEVLRSLFSLPIKARVIEATRLATDLGDHRAANVVMLGYAIAATRLGEAIDIKAAESAVAALGEISIRALRAGYALGANN